MINIFRKICNFLNSSFRNSRARTELSTYKPCYRIADINTSIANEPSVTIQMIGKNITFKIAPETLLADNKLVNCFSPTDIRTLTYLGYLGINSPKYKILAKLLFLKLYHCYNESIESINFYTNYTLFCYNNKRVGAVVLHRTLWFLMFEVIFVLLLWLL